MKALLDTNILIHRETNNIIRDEIGYLFRWLDELSYEKCIHRISISEIERNQNQSTVQSFKAKLNSYRLLQTEAPETPKIEAIRREFDKNENDSNDTALLKEVFSNRVDILITEDKKIHEKAEALEIQSRVLTIEQFLERCVAENPNLVNYQVLSVRQQYFGNINLNDPFFDSFKEDYPGFGGWFNRKSEETAYVCQREENVLAFLYLKVENEDEDYSDVVPTLTPKRRLKIGTFKVSLNGFKLGERFLKIIFDNALRFNVDEIYVTIFDRTDGQVRLIDLLEGWGFIRHGVKNSGAGQELVYVRDFRAEADIYEPTKTYPFISANTRKFIVPIYPEYHTELFPDSVLRTESPLDFVENRPNRNAINKVYISRSFERSLIHGDIIVFYRTKFRGPAHYTSVATTIGVVQSVTDNISDLDAFIRLCRKRSVFSDAELKEHWDYSPHNRPFVVDFLYVHTFPKRLNLKKLKEMRIISDAPRGFEEISYSAFNTLMEESNGDQRLIVN